MFKPFSVDQSSSFLLVAPLYPLEGLDLQVGMTWWALFGIEALTSWGYWVVSLDSGAR